MMDEKQITDFFDNLKQSVLDYNRQGEAVYLMVEHDTEPVAADFGMTPVDSRYCGATYQVLMGRPAARQIAKDEQGRLEIEARVSTQPDHVATISK